MATITPYETAGGKRYRVRYRKPDGSQTDKRGFATKKAAEIWAADAEVKKAKGQFIDPSLARATVAHLAPAWLTKKEHNLKPSAYSPIEASWRSYVEPRWAETPVSRITATEVEAWITELGKGTAPYAGKRKIPANTARSATVVIRAVGVLAGILDDALKDERLHKNPARGAENLPDKTPKLDRTYLTHKQVARLVESIPDDLRAALVLVLAYTGLRWGEAIALRVRDVNLLHSRINVVRSATQVDGKIHVGTPKSWEARTIRFPALLTEVFEHRVVGGADSLLFPGSGNGFMMRPHTRAERPSWFSRAVTVAELPNMTPHDLRHTAASLAVSSGANVKVLQRMLGHKSAAMTLDVYADLFDDDLEAVATSLNDHATISGVGKMWANRLSGAR